MEAPSLEEMEATISHFCSEMLADLAQNQSWTRSPKLADNIKFLSEIIIAFKESDSPAAERILQKAQQILFSDEARLLLACNPTISSYLLTAYASVPVRYPSKRSEE